MTCFDPEAVVEGLIGRLCAARLGPYRIEYLNDAGPYHGVESEHLGVLERRGRVVDVIDVDSDFVRSLVDYYGAEGVAERY